MKQEQHRNNQCQHRHHCLQSYLLVMRDRPSYLAYLVSEGSPKKAGAFCENLSLRKDKDNNKRLLVEIKVATMFNFFP